MDIDAAMLEFIDESDGPKPHGPQFVDILARIGLEILTKLGAKHNEENIVVVCSRLHLMFDMGLYVGPKLDKPS